MPGRSTTNELLLRDYDDKIDLYVRLARIFRHRVRTGLWKPGSQIPTIPVLCKEFNVSRPPVRQAIALLARDGVLQSTRGRGTFVAKDLVSTLDNQGLKLSISDPLAMGEGQTIKILKRWSVDRLPDEVQTDEPQYETYVVMRKTHSYASRPFTVMDVYVAKRLYAKIPRGFDTKSKIAPLLQKYAGLKPKRYRQEVTVVHATKDVARDLKVPEASVCVRIRRWWIDDKQRIVLVSFGYYRTDTFILDVTVEKPGNSLFSLASPVAKGT